MKKIISLAKVMLKNSFGAQFNDRKELSPTKKVLRFLGFGALYAYLVVMTFLITKDSIKGLQAINQAPIIIYSSLAGLSIYLFFTLIISIPSILYFSKDTDNLLPLPLTPREILMAKYFSIYIMALISLSFLYLPMGINYFVQVDQSILFLLRYLLVALVLPLIPMMVSSLVIVIIFSFIPKANNKDIFTYVSSIFLFVVIFAVSYTSGLNSDGGGFWIEMLTNSDGPLIDTITSVIPSIPLLAKFITNNNILSGLLALVISLTLAYITLLITEQLYFKGLLSSTDVKQSNKKFSKKALIKQNQVKSPLQSLISADYKNIFRTPVLAINYIITLVIFPIGMAFPLILIIKETGFNKVKENLEVIQFLFTGFDLKYLLTGTAFIAFVLSYFMSSLTTIASTSFTREGENMLNYKALPIDTMDVVHAKLMVANTISSISGIILSCLAIFILNLGFPYYLIAILASLLGANLANLEGVLLDSLYPKLVWEDITQAIKQNFIAVIPIFSSFLILAVMVYSIVKWPKPLTASLILMALLILEIILYYIIKTKSVYKLNKAIENI